MIETGGKRYGHGIRILTFSGELPGVDVVVFGNLEAEFIRFIALANAGYLKPVLSGVPDEALAIASAQMKTVQFLLDTEADSVVIDGIGVELVAVTVEPPFGSAPETVIPQ